MDVMTFAMAVVFGSSVVMFLFGFALGKKSAERDVKLKQHPTWY